MRALAFPVLPGARSLSRRGFLLSAAASAQTAPPVPSVDFRHGDLRVSGNRRFLMHADGTPFFYLGDTAWELFHRLNREDAEVYLEDRRRKRFTVIQAVVLAELDGLETPNSYGHVPLEKKDPARPNEEYFRHVDCLVRMAEDKGLVIGMLPTWGNKVTRAGWEPSSSIIFNPGNARAYGRFIGARYKGAQNLIWILGGDRNPEGVEEVWRAMAAGIREGDGGRHLMTFHPQGRGSSSSWFHNEPWLDFNMMQSGHNRRDLRNDEMIAADYAHFPVKPCMDGEPRYDNHPVDWRPERNGWFDQHDVRQAAWWAVFAGAHGHTYGCHDIWQMRTPEREPVGFARGTWRESLRLPGSLQMGFLRRLMESRPFFSRVPAQSLIAAGGGFGGATVRATRGDGYAMFYIPAGNRISVQLGAHLGRRLRAWWFNPRRGDDTWIGDTPSRGVREFNPPGSPGRGNDWVLILDDAARNFPRPGVTGFQG